jgi:DNA-binding NtrC family response regulator
MSAMGTSKGRILVVEDEAVIRQSIEIVLTQNGFEVVQAANGKEALEQHAQRRCDLLLVDKNLPGVSGLEVVRSLRAAGDAVPVVMMTGYGSVETAIDALHLRISAYIEKPFEDIFALPGLLEQAFERQRAVTHPTVALGHFKRAQAALEAARLQRPAPADDKPAAAESASPGLAILVVGPAGGECEAVTRWVTSSDDRVEHRSKAASALEDLPALLPDLVIVDAWVTSPDVFGFVEQTHARSAHAVCVVVTDKPKLETITRLIRLDVRAILEKPVDARQVQERLEPIIKQLRREVRT